jgi:hypothetical protein
MRRWIIALLDPSPIEKGAKDRHNSHIQMPPRFDVEKAAQAPPVILPPGSALRSTRARASRSVSPSKMVTPSRKIASPRKPRTTRSAAKPDTTNGEEFVETKFISVTSSLQNEIENGITPSESVASESVNGELKEADNVRIEVQETVEQNGDVETTTTNVKIDVPADYPELPTPEDTTRMMEEARRMVEEAKKTDGVLEKSSATHSGQRKRKAVEVSKDDDEVEEALEGRPAKLAKTSAYTTEQKLTKEKVTRRALVGLTVMAAIG